MESRDANELWVLINEEITDAISLTEQAEKNAAVLVKVLRDECPKAFEVLISASLSGTLMLTSRTLKELKEMYFVPIPEEDKANGNAG
jgi:hypothetical protein